MGNFIEDAEINLEMERRRLLAKKEAQKKEEQAKKEAKKLKEGKPNHTIM